MTFRTNFCTTLVAEALADECDVALEDPIWRGSRVVKNTQSLVRRLTQVKSSLHLLLTTSTKHQQSRLVERHRSRIATLGGVLTRSYSPIVVSQKLY